MGLPNQDSSSNNEPITTPVLNLMAAVYIKHTVQKAEPVELQILWQQKDLEVEFTQRKLFEKTKELNAAKC